MFLSWLDIAQAMLPAPVGRVWPCTPWTNGIGTTSQLNLLAIADRMVGRLPRTSTDIATWPESNIAVQLVEFDR